MEQKSCQVNSSIMHYTRRESGEFDTRWDEVLLSMSKIPSHDLLESLYRLRIRESDQLKTFLELYDLEIHQLSKVENHGKEEYRSETSVTKLRRQAWEN